MKITDTEAKLIDAYRAENERLKNALELRLEILRVSYEYEKWLRENKAGSTYSTFCDDFGYGGSGGNSRREMFEHVSALRKCAQHCVQPTPLSLSSAEIPGDSSRRG